MKFKTIAHIAFKVSDMGASLRFYCDGLGFRKKFGLKDEKGRPWLIYLEIVPCQFLELYYDYDDSPKANRVGPKQIGYLHLSLEVENIQAVREELMQKGITPDSEIKMQADHTYQLWVTDPDGNRIEFMEYTSESLQIQEEIEENYVKEV